MSPQCRPPESKMRQTQPKAFKLNVKALLSLPYRLCNPPPAVGKVRSCGVTPVFKVQLEDVLNRKHLPPLGLKDFEEWLLYVERCPENLYFILWLKEYTTKYNQWAHQSEPCRPNTSSMAYRFAWPSNPTSSSLALFYARAKQTFFTPDYSSPYELKISSGILSPFHTSKFGSPHPDPAVFAEVATEVRKMLKESLDRMVVSAYTNVGNNRGLCGIIGGCCIMLLGSIAPLVINFLNGRNRWLRLLAIPGMWLGMTVLWASLHGVCLMVYIFGDIRQLRKFELSRPPISRPRTLSNAPTRPVISPPSPLAASGPIVQPPNLPIFHPVQHNTPPQPPRLNIPSLPVATHIRSVSSSPGGSSTYTLSSDGGSASVSSLSASEGHDDAAHTIEISPAFYDDSHVEGPATGSPSSARYNNTVSMYFDSKSRLSDAEFTPTASFIHPYDQLCDDDSDRSPEPTPEERQGLESFDFDLLPKRRYTFPEQDQAVSVAMSGAVEGRSMAEKDREGAIDGLRSPMAILRHFQQRCNKQNLSTDLEKNTPPSRSLNAPSPSPPRLVDPAAQFKMVQAVPAFASPFTRVLNPVVTRAQWEIVVRSAAVAALICWIIVGCLVAIPVSR